MSVVSEILKNEGQLLQQAVALLRTIVPNSWTVQVQRVSTGRGSDDQILLQAPGGLVTTFLPEIRLTSSPREIQRVTADPPLSKAHTSRR